MAKFKFDLTKIFQLLPIIMAGVDEAETLFVKHPGETPAEKAARNAQQKSHVMNLVALTVAGTNTAAGKVLLDPVMSAIAADNLIDGVVAAAKVRPPKPVAEVLPSAALGQLSAPPRKA
jgi:hypothetical protein